MGCLFFIPISTTLSEGLALLVVLLWVADRNFKEKFAEIHQNKVSLAILMYIALHVLGLLWTEDMTWGIYVVKKQWKLLLMPIFLNMVRKEHTQHYLYAFLTSMAFSVFVSYLMWFGLIEQPAMYSNPSKIMNHLGTYIDSLGYIVPYSSPTPFNSHIIYNPLLAFTIYALINQLFLNFRKTKTEVILLLVITIALMTFNMLITHGRTGQIALFVLIILSIFQFIKKTFHRTLAIGICFLVVTISYLNISTFHQRIDQTIYNLNNFSTKSVDSISERLTFFSISYEIIKEHPLIGVGTGDFPLEYRHLTQQIFPKSYFQSSENPHNQYLLVLTQFGFSGLLIFLTIFYQQTRYAFASSPATKHLKLATPVFFMIIMFGDSYLQTSMATLFFVALSSVLFKNS